MPKTAAKQQSLFGGDETGAAPAPAPAPPVRYKPATFYRISLDTLKPDPGQPRVHFAEEALESLATSLRQQGVIQPVLFRLDDRGEAILVAGERRWRAARRAGLKTIPALCVTGDPLEISMMENMMREELSAVELAEALGRLREVRSYTLEQLSVLIGRAVSTVSEILSLNRLPPSVRDACRADRSVPRDVLVRIARAATPEEMERLFRRYRSGIPAGRRQEGGTALRPVKFSTLSRHLTASTARITSVDVTALKPAQRKKLKPILQKAVGELTSLLESLEKETSR